MIDKTQARRSEVLKLDFGLEDFNLFRSCLAEAVRRGIQNHEVQELAKRNIADLSLLIRTMLSEGTIE